MFDLYEACEKFLKLAKKEKDKKKLDSKAKVRSRGECCLPAEHPMVTDNKDHYPITSRAQAMNAISRVNQHSEAPPWFKGSLKSLIDIVYRKVHAKYPGIKIDPKKKKPGKQS